MEATNNETIFIVDDTVESVEMLRDLLNSAGYHVVVANSGVSALTQLEQIKPDLILLDIVMPGTDGFELYQQLRALPRMADIPIIFLSALNSSDAIVQGLNLDAVDFITKPFSIKEVLARIERHLRLQRLQNQIKAKNAQLGQEIAERKKSTGSFKATQL